MALFSKNDNDLTQRMESIDAKRDERRKRIKKDYDSTKNSPDYYKSRALEKLAKIIDDNPFYEEFKLYVQGNPQEFSEEERKEIEKLLNSLINSQGDFEQWKINHI